MFDGWENFYLIVGPSAGALIGLMFVVVTLTAGRDRSEVERGKHLYTSPIVWHLGVVLLLSGAAVAPGLSSKLFAVTSGGLALMGVAMSVRSAIGIARAQFAGPVDSVFDLWWYGVVPAVVYVGLGGAAVTVFAGWSWSGGAVAAALMALLLVSIHAEWDLVTYLAPRAEEPAKRSPRSKKP